MNIGDVDNDELVLGALSSSLAGAFGRDAVAWRCLSGRRAVSLCLDGRTRPDVLLMDVSCPTCPASRPAAASANATATCRSS